MEYYMAFGENEAQYYVESSQCYFVKWKGQCENSAYGTIKQEMLITSLVSGENEECIILCLNFVLYICTAY